jgi:hypothetical protein
MHLPDFDSATWDAAFSWFWPVVFGAAHGVFQLRPADMEDYMRRTSCSIKFDTYRPEGRCVHSPMGRNPKDPNLKSQ